MVHSQESAARRLHAAKPVDYTALSAHYTALSAHTPNDTINGCFWKTFLLTNVTDQNISAVNYDTRSIRLVGLSLLSIENDIAKALDFSAFLQ
jgi:hypothetical protein